MTKPNLICRNNPAISENLMLELLLIKAASQRSELLIMTYDMKICNAMTKLYLSNIKKIITSLSIWLIRFSILYKFLKFFGMKKHPINFLKLIGCGNRLANLASKALLLLSLYLQLSQTSL